MFVISLVFAAFSLENRDRHRATEQWVSNSSLFARLAYRAGLIYFHFVTLKTVGSGYSNIFINLPRLAHGSPEIGCCGNWRKEKKHVVGNDKKRKENDLAFVLVFIIYDSYILLVIVSKAFIAFVGTVDIFNLFAIFNPPYFSPFVLDMKYINNNIPRPPNLQRNTECSLYVAILITSSQITNDKHEQDI